MSDHPGHRPSVPRPLSWQTYGHSPHGVSFLAHSHHPEVHKDGMGCLGMLSFSTSGYSDLEIQSGIHDAGGNCTSHISQGKKSHLAKNAGCLANPFRLFPMHCLFHQPLGAYHDCTCLVLMTTWLSLPLGLCVWPFAWHLWEKLCIMCVCMEVVCITASLRRKDWEEQSQGCGRGSGPRWAVSAWSERHWDTHWEGPSWLLHSHEWWPPSSGIGPGSQWLLANSTPHPLAWQSSGSGWCHCRCTHLESVQMMGWWPKFDISIAFAFWRAHLRTACTCFSSSIHHFFWEKHRVRFLGPAMAGTAGLPEAEVWISQSSWLAPHFHVWQTRMTIFE